MVRTLHGDAAMRAIQRPLLVPALLLGAGLFLGAACGSAEGPTGSSGTGASTTSSAAGCMQFFAVCTCTCEGVAVPGLLGFASSCSSVQGTPCGDAGTGDAASDGGDAGSAPVYESCVKTGLQNDC
jgi:hypothetical protein